MSEMVNLNETGRIAAAEHAALLVHSGMRVGLGTGSTAAWLVKALGRRMREESLSITVAATSSRCDALARAEGMIPVGPDEIGTFDLTIDGADECDSDLHLIKGGGGALFREKIVASNSAAMVVIADKSKEVECLGAFPLPVEVTRFAWRTTHARILACLASSGMDAASGRLRRNAGEPFVTDEGNLILDYNTGPIADPPDLHAELKRIVGVVETGIFPGLCRMAVFGDGDGKLTIRGSLDQQ